MSEDRLSDIACSKCGGALYEDDKFCSDCGEEVPRCPNCGAIIPKDAKFCFKCRFNLKAKNECPACGTVLPRGALFCPGCGADAPGASPAPAPRFEARAGSYVKFGKYPQCHGDTPEPIEWLVLENDGKTALLLSKYGLDCKQFHHEKVNIFWRDCDLREWLNGEFMDRAFSAEERKQIAESAINTADNPEFGTKGCGETRDKVFCLSIEEAWKYFGNVKENYGCTEKWHSDVADMDLWVNRERACQPTAYAVANGAVQGKRVWEDEAKGKASEWWFDNCFFWLRSPGNRASRAASVGDYGAVGIDGYYVSNVRRAVRPALRIIL